MTLALNLILFASSTSNALSICFLSIEMYISEGIEKMWKAMKVIKKKIHEENSALQISYPTVYRGINRGLFDREHAREHTGNFKRILRHKGKRLHRQNIKENRGKFDISHHINERPIGCPNRTRIGHFECDTVGG